MAQSESDEGSDTNEVASHRAPKRRGRRGGSLVFALGWLCGCSVLASESLDLGPLFDQFALTLDPGQRTEIAGPLYHHEQRDTTRLWAAPPVFAYTRDEDVDFEEFDFVYPLLGYDRFGDEYRFHIFQILSFAGGQSQSGTNDSRFTLFPLYFQQRSADRSRIYHAVFPIYGHLENRLFRREIDWVLWPLYVKTVKRSAAPPPPEGEFLGLGTRWLQSLRGDMTTYNFIVPFFHYRVGEELRGWQFWPLFGREVQGSFTRTNTWGDPMVIPGHRHSFALWPIFFDQRRGFGTDNPEHFQAVLPLYSFLRSPARDSTSYLAPLGLTITHDRARNYREVGAPWPLIVFARGAGKTTSRVFPFFSHAYNTNLQSDFYAWPVYKYNRFHTESFERERTRILYFLYSDMVERDLTDDRTKRRVDLWPLFTWKRDWEGRSRLQVLALLEPFLPNNKSIERNYSPLWSVWRSERNGQTGARSQSLLWNLYRHEETTTTKKDSLLFELFQYQSRPDGSRYRLFFIPLGGARASAGGAD